MAKPGRLGSIPGALAGVLLVVTAELFRAALGRFIKRKFGNKGE